MNIDEVKLIDNEVDHENYNAIYWNAINEEHQMTIENIPDEMVLLKKP